MKVLNKTYSTRAGRKFGSRQQLNLDPTVHVELKGITPMFSVIGTSSSLKQTSELLPGNDFWEEIAASS